GHGRDTHRVVEDRRAHAHVQRLTGRGVAAHVRPVAHDRDVVDVAVAEPLLEVGAGEAAGQLLVDQMVVRTRGDLGTQLLRGSAGLEGRTTGLADMAHDDDRYAARGRMVHRRGDALEAVVAGRVADRQAAGEVL